MATMAEYLAEKIEALREMKPVDGKPAAYVCENFTCQAPVTDPKALANCSVGDSSAEPNRGGFGGRRSAEPIVSSTARQSLALPKPVDCPRERFRARRMFGETLYLWRCRRSGLRVASGNFLRRRRRSQLFQVLRMLSRGVR